MGYRKAHLRRGCSDLLIVRWIDCVLRDHVPMGRCWKLATGPTALRIFSL